MPADQIIPLTLAHSPDPDDAFMWWPLLELDGRPSAIDTGRFRFTTEAADIETLNTRAERGELDITAISCAQYPRVRAQYALTACGASIGDGYGPKLVARESMTLDELRRGHATIAVPGERTTAFLVTSLLLGPGKFRHRVVPFEEIINRVADGAFDAGVVIHEGQLTFERNDLRLVVDLGAWWRETQQLPLPLGGNLVKRDLDERFGSDTTRAVARVLHQSVRYAMDHPERGVAYAMPFARGMSEELAGRFINLYVNRWTLDFGDLGRAALARLLGLGHEAGLLPDPGDIDFIDAEPAGASP